MVAIAERHKTRSRGWEMPLQAVTRRPVTSCRFGQSSGHWAACVVLPEVTIWLNRRDIRTNRATSPLGPDVWIPEVRVNQAARTTLPVILLKTPVDTWNVQYENLDAICPGRLPFRSRFEFGSGIRCHGPVNGCRADGFGE